MAALLAATLARAWQEFRFEGTAFEPPDGWSANPDARSGLWQVQRRSEVGRDRGAALIQITRPLPASDGPFDAVLARLAGSIPGLERERLTTKGEGVTAAGHRSGC